MKSVNKFAAKKLMAAFALASAVTGCGNTGNLNRPLIGTAVGGVAAHILSENSQHQGAITVLGAILGNQVGASATHPCAWQSDSVRGHENGQQYSSAQMRQSCGGQGPAPAGY